MKMLEVSENFINKLQNTDLLSDRTAEFGDGKTIPVYFTSNDQVGLIICEHQGSFEVGESVSAEIIQELTRNAIPLTVLSFKKGEDGLKGLDAFRKWLDAVEDRLRDEESWHFQ